jgi:MFS family permease
MAGLRGRASSRPVDTETAGRLGSPQFWVVAFGVFVAADDLMVVATMLRPIIDDLGLIIPDDLDATAWIVNVYLIAYLTAMPLAGKLSDIIGRRAVFMASLVLFAIGSLIVPATDSFAVLLVGRAISAVGGGALVPIAFAVAGDLHTGAQRTRALGLLGAIETMGWVWGPMYGAVLVRFLSWQWQFHLNVPLALIGMAIGWRVLDPVKRSGRRIDWWGAGLLTIGLIALSVALLGQARIQSVTGLEELRGTSTPWWSGPWLYVVAVVAFGAFAVVERRVAAGGEIDPIVSPSILGGRAPAAAMAVNGLVGVGLVIALVNVPLFLNIVENSGIGPTAVLAGGLLTALTATMAVTSYLGGVAAARWGNRATIVIGVSLALIGFAIMGSTWDADTPYRVMALELALIGAGIGLVLAPTTAAVVDAAAEDERGGAAGLVIVFRLIGFSVGLAGLTAWGLHRYGVLRDQLELPALGEPGYETALADAAVDITTTALAETFAGSAIALGIALAVALLIADDPAPAN